MTDAHSDIPHKAQVGALVVRGKPGSQEVLLVTSRDTGRWIIPKGWPMKGKQDHEAAAQEAFEEAGVKGKIHRNPMGAYTYEKRVGGQVEPIRVMVYVLEVAEKLKDWPEKSERRRQWMTTAEASTLVDEPGLSGLLLRLNAMPDAERRRLANWTPPKTYAVGSRRDSIGLADLGAERCGVRLVSSISTSV